MLLTDKKNIVDNLVDLLLYPNSRIGFGAKQGLIKAVRPRKGKGFMPLEAGDALEQQAESDEEVLASVVDRESPFAGGIVVIFRDFLTFNMG